MRILCIASVCSKKVAQIEQSTTSIARYAFPQFQLAGRIHRLCSCSEKSLLACKQSMLCAASLVNSLYKPVLYVCFADIYCARLQDTTGKSECGLSDLTNSK